VFLIVFFLFFFPTILAAPLLDYLAMFFIFHFHSAKLELVFRYIFSNNPFFFFQPDSLFFFQTPKLPALLNFKKKGKKLSRLALTIQEREKIEMKVL